MNKGHSKKKSETYNRLTTVVETVMAREETLAYVEKLERSFKPYKSKVRTADDFWVWIDSLKRKPFSTLSSSERNFVEEVYGLVAYIEKLYGGIFDENFNVLLASYILFKKFPKKHKFLGVELRIVGPNEKEGFETHAEIIIKAGAIQREVVAFIESNWNEISASVNRWAELDELDKMAFGSKAFLLPKQRTKTTLKRDKRILQLRKKETYKEIQSVLAHEEFGLVSLATIRKVVSNSKKE